MTVSINKSFFGRREVKYLGYILGREGMSIDKQKQLAITDAPFPKTAAEIHRLVGSAALPVVLPKEPHKKNPIKRTGFFRVSPKRTRFFWAQKNRPKEPGSFGFRLITCP
jgi:hypothetical protein